MEKTSGMYLGGSISIEEEIYYLWSFSTSYFSLVPSISHPAANNPDKVL